MLLVTFAFLLPLEITAFLTAPSSPRTRTSSNQNYKSSDPTRVTSSLITPGPNLHEQALLGRDIFGRGTFNTCGYVSGNAASPLTCPTGFDCTSTQVYDLSWACCNQIECKGAYRQCVDYGGKDICEGLDRSICDGIYTSVLRCSSSSPYCISYARSSSLGDEEIETSLACGASGGEVLVLITPTNGKAEDGDSAPSTTGGSSPSQAADTTSEVDLFSPITAASSSSRSTSSPPPSKNDGGAKLSAGAITGIVIPVAAMIVGIIAAWWRPHQVLWIVSCFMCGSRRSKKPNPVDPSHATQPLMLHPYRQPSPVNHGPRYYPPQASVYAVNNPAPHIYPQGVWQNGNYR